MSQKGFSAIFLLIAFVVLATAGVYYYSKPSSPPVSTEMNDSMQLYTNTTDRYSIQYPKDWYVYKIKEYPYEGYPGVLPTGDDILVTSLPHFPRLTPDNSEEYTGLQIQAMNKNNPDASFGLDLDKRIKASMKIEEIKINGVRAFKESQNDGDVTYFIPFQDKEGWIMVTFYGVKDMKMREILEQMVSTIQIN